MSLDIYLVVEECPACGRPREDVVAMNITHNVSPMWRLVGVRDALYESHGRLAEETLPALRAGVATMRERIVDCRALNPPNGWGDADRALEWLGEWLEACERYPRARIRVSA